MKKRTLKITLALVLPILVVTAVFFAFRFLHLPMKSPDAFVASANSYVGSCGENIKWSLNTVTGKLKLNGNGEFHDYDSPMSVPWNTYSKYIKEIVIENGITEIAPYLFSSAKELTYVQIPRSVKSIGTDAFYGCSSLDSVDFAESSSLEIIGENAFAYCRSLKNFDFPTKVTTVGKNAFSCCYSLNDITLGYSVTSVAEGAFSSCSHLKKLRIVNYECDIFDDGETIYRNIEIECFSNSTAKDYAEKYLRTYTVIKDMKNINDMKVKLSFDECVYDGKKKKPQVIIKGLTNGTDYTVNYSKNTNPGIASITVSAAGTTLGERTLYFKIKPQRPKNLRVRKADTDNITLTWSVVTGASGYEVYQSVDGKWKKVAKTSDDKVTVKKLSEATQYKFKVIAYVETDSERIDSAFSSELTCSTAPAKVKITSISNRGIGRLTVSWNKVKDADGYIIYTSTKKKSGYKEAAVINSGSRTQGTVLNLVSNKKYYVTVKAFVKVGDTKVSSEDGNIVSKSPM